MGKMKRQIIALGGGSFPVAGRNPALELYALAQTRKANPSICFLPTATGDAPTYIAKFYAIFAKERCRPSHISFFERTPRLREILLAQDLIYVGGGNTKSMLAVWREWQVPRILRQAWNSGIVLAGVSAGAICWFDVGVTDSWAEHLAPLPCLGWLPGACCPHYHGEAERLPSVHKFVAKGIVPQTLALDDGAAAHFVGRKLKRIVCSGPDAGAFLVRRVGRSAVETALPVTRLK
ncbi:MAG TPA: peptidase E [Candidatus Acidoferrales bacterium]|nr:peptidase E [Candidatus Acidoferrales bacterium]